MLSRVAGILAARGFNIDSLVVCSTEIKDLSRMCIVLSGQDGVVEQARRQLEDLVRMPSLIDERKNSFRVLMGHPYRSLYGQCWTIRTPVASNESFCL